MQFKYMGFYKTIVIPSLLGIFFLPFPKIPVEGPTWYKVIIYGITAPLAEEILFRGCFIGLFGYCVANKFNFRKKTKILWVGLWICVSSIIFYIQHQRGINIHLFAATFFYVMLYLSGKNLLPLVVAHMVNNLLIVLDDVFWKERTEDYNKLKSFWGQYFRDLSSIWNNTINSLPRYFWEQGEYLHVYKLRMKKDLDI